jgi:hypothetical protein
MRIMNSSDQEISEEAHHQVLALAEAISRTRSDLAATIERVITTLDADERRELLEEMTLLESQHPGAFLAGAMAGYALGQGKGIVHDDHPGVVSAPVDTAQTGPGGLGTLEAPRHDD